MLLATGALAMPRAARSEDAVADAGPAAATGDATLLAGQPLIRRSRHPPNYESSLTAFRSPITANDQFFIRAHSSQIPDRAALASWSLTIGGDGAGRPAKLAMADLLRLPQNELAAVCQCAGNRRGLSRPAVAGIQWGVGAMGCAVWRGPRLRDVLALSGIDRTAVEIALHGADGVATEAQPEFVKSLPIDRALDDNTLVALTMNEVPLPIAHGFPARLVVAGWTATYWMKSLATVEIRTTRLDNFWMSSAYRVPAGLFPGSAFPTQDSATSRPITDIVVNALATSHQNGDRVRGAGFALEGLAWDNGSGIARVEISINDGATWGIAMLGPEQSRFAFRPWRIQLASSPGRLRPMIRTTARSGATQPETPVFNPGGYHHNAVQTLDLIAV